MDALPHVQLSHAPLTATAHGLSPRAVAARRFLSAVCANKCDAARRKQLRQTLPHLGDSPPNCVWQSSGASALPAVNSVLSVTTFPSFARIFCPTWQTVNVRSRPQPANKAHPSCVQPARLLLFCFLAGRLTRIQSPPHRHVLALWRSLPSPTAAQRRPVLYLWCALTSFNRPISLLIPREQTPYAVHPVL